MPSLTPFIALVRKDILLYLGNRRTLVVNLMAPILMAAFFGYVLNPNTNKKPAHIPIAIVDLDGGATSQKIVVAMKADSTVDLLITDETTAIAEVRAGKRRAAIVLPKNFGADAGRAIFQTSAKPNVQLHIDPSQSYIASIVNGLLAQHAMQAVFSTQFVGEAAQANAEIATREINAASGLTAIQKTELTNAITSFAKFGKSANTQTATANDSNKADASRGFTLPFSTESHEVTSGVDRKYNSFAHSFAGMSVQFVLFMGVEFGVGLLLMRRMGLWKRLLAAPITRRDIVGSRIVGGILISLVLVLLIYTAAITVFGVRIDGSVIGFIGVALAFSMLTASFGLLIASLGKTPEATRGLAIFATLILVMLGGAWVPSFVFPEWLQSASLFTPTRWAVDGFSAMTWRGQGLDAALAPIGAMTGFAVFFTLVAMWRFQWDE